MIAYFRRKVGLPESEAITAWNDDVFADVPQWFRVVAEFIDTEVCHHK
jgi:hypothetical protein